MPVLVALLVRPPSDGGDWGACTDNTSFDVAFGGKRVDEGDEDGDGEDADPEDGRRGARFSRLIPALPLVGDRVHEGLQWDVSEERRKSGEGTHVRALGHGKVPHDAPKMKGDGAEVVERVLGQGRVDKLLANDTSDDLELVDVVLHLSAINKKKRSANGPDPVPNPTYLSRTGTAVHRECSDGIKQTLLVLVLPYPLPRLDGRGAHDDSQRLGRPVPHRHPVVGLLVLLHLGRLPQPIDDVERQVDELGDGSRAPVGRLRQVPDESDRLPVEPVSELVVRLRADVMRAGETALDVGPSGEMGGPGEGRVRNGREAFRDEGAGEEGWDGERVERR